MRVLAIDPGFDRCGVAILEYSDGKEVLLFSTCITTDKAAPLPVRITTIGQQLETIITAHRPTALGIETLFFNKNITTGIGVAQARGVVLYVAERAGLSIYEHGPQEVKVAVTGYGNSDKTAMYAMLQRLVPNIPAKAHDDEYDAIAVGVTTLAQHGRTR
ncbi:MAG: crossover junction endodeoxyribonuclease RuvC [Candidatus Pacebacteria bacterium]|jgi:crossover junction endodeoxyribonuclease RuvC|nr:crossover junction endodeoxyribonuclease RuvC [Candidatus Paceibacterota bacterium]